MSKYEKPMSWWSYIVQLCSYSETLRRKLRLDGLHGHERRRIEVFVALKRGLKARRPSHLSLELGCGAKNRQIEKQEIFLGKFQGWQTDPARSFGGPMNAMMLSCYNTHGDSQWRPPSTQATDYYTTL
jgi:hypothetical protein